MRRSIFTPERREHLTVEMRLDKSACDKHDISLFNPPPRVLEGDTFLLTYDFWVEYFGVVAELESLRKIISDPDVIVSIDIGAEEVDSLFISLIDEIRAVQSAILQRSR